MRLTRLTALVAVLVAALLALSGSAGAVSRTDAAQWSLGSSRPSVNVSYGFKNLINSSYTNYGKRTWGVDLVWGSYSAQWSFLPDTGSPNIRDHRRRAMVPGEKVAIYNSSTRRYLVYGSQTFGINLTWSSRPSYQWKIGSDTASGNASLFNTVANDYVVYGQRPVGINLRWLKDVKRTEGQNAPGSLHDASVTMSAQPVVQGFVPFLGFYGGGAGFNAVLTKVSNPANGTPLAFVKPGHSTSECGSDSAVTTLAPGKTMSAEQMTTLYGSARPSLTQRIAFLACAGTNASAVFLNVQYQQL